MRIKFLQLKTNWWEASCSADQGKYVVYINVYYLQL